MLSIAVNVFDANKWIALEGPDGASSGIFVFLSLAYFT